MNVNQVPYSAQAQARSAKRPASNPDNPLFQSLLDQCGASRGPGAPHQAEHCREKSLIWPHWEQYRAWEAAQAPQQLPDSKGLTEEAAPLDGSEQEIDSIEDFCSKVFLPGWLERLKELDRMEEEEQTLNILLDYVDALVEQAKEENRLKLRAEQLQFWLSRAR